MRSFKKALLAAAATSLVSTSALSAGFSTEGVNPGGALFNNKSFVIQGAIGLAIPQRDYENGVGTSQSGAAAAGQSSSDASPSFVLLNGDIKARVNDNIDCLLRGHQPWRLNNEVSDTFVGRYEQSKFEINSIGIDAVCSYKFAVSEDAQVRVFGGVRSVQFEADRTNFVTGAGLIGGGFPIPGALATSDFTNTYSFENDGVDFGYRVGLAFEIPKFLLRAQIVYDSGIQMDLEGTQTITGPADVLATPAFTKLRLPQSVSARVQSGVNETTLVWAGAKWQNWGDVSGLNIDIPINPALDRVLTTGWNDAWTLEIGAAKKLTDDLALQGSITWNQGIGGGYTDTWSFATGVQYDIDDNWRVSRAASATLLTDSTETSNGVGGGASSSAYQQGNDWAFAVGTRIQYAID